jgi:hypothetical protein
VAEARQLVQELEAQRAMKASGGSVASSSSASSGASLLSPPCSPISQPATAQQAGLAFAEGLQAAPPGQQHDSAGPGSAGEKLAQQLNCGKREA